MIFDRDATQNAFRDAVLKAFDEIARELFGNAIPAKYPGDGATDADLPRLFKAVYAQVDVLAQRFGIEWERK